MRPAFAAALAALLAAAAGPAASAPGDPTDGAPETRASPLDLPLPLALMLEGEDVPFEEWRAMTAGRTVWYRIDDALWGREHYWPGTFRVTFQFPDGECLEATWTYDDLWYCFDFGGALGLDGPHCFRHLRHEGALYALGAGGQAQAVDRIDDAPVACGPDATS